MRFIGSVLAPGVSAPGDILAKTDRLSEAFELGRALVAEVRP
jgi:hypothetical protein